MRLFVGITPSTEAVSHATGATDRRGAQAAPDGLDRIASTTPDVRWIPPQRWHMTLAFLGEVDPDRVPVLAARLNEVADAHEPLRALRLAGAGTFQHAMLAAGVPVQRRPWRPHLTIARWATPPRDRRESTATSSDDVLWGRSLLTRALIGYAGPAFDVRKIRLVHSITGPQPEYRDLHVARLKGGAGQGAGTT